MRYVSCNEISDTLQTDVVQIPNYLISFDIKRVEITDKFACIRKTEFGSNVRKKRFDGLHTIRNDQCSNFYFSNAASNASSLPRKCGTISKYYRES